jgi:hypothetical protein
MFRRLFLIAILLFGLAMFSGAAPAALREYFYFYSREAKDDLLVMRFNEAGTVLDAARVLIKKDSILGVAAAKNAAGEYIVITMESPNFALRQWVFTPPGTLTGGQKITTSSPYLFNMDATATFPGGILGTSEDVAPGSFPFGLRLSSDGTPIGDFVKSQDRIDQNRFASIRRNGSEAVDISFCCASPQLLLQPLKSSLRPNGDPILIAQTTSDFLPEAIRIDDDGRFVIVASGSGQGLLLYRLDAATRKAVGAPSALVTGELRFFDSTHINENGSFVLFTTAKGPGNVRMIQTDGNGHFVGTAKKLITVGDNLNYSYLIRAN